MALKALSVNSVRNYIPLCERESDNPTIFELGVNDSRIHGMIHDKLNTLDMVKSASAMEGLTEEDRKKIATDLTAKLPMNEVAFEYVSFGLRGWKNFKDDDGESDLRMKTVTRIINNKKYTIASPDSVGMISGNIIQELYEELLTNGEVAEEDEKN